VLRYCNKMPPPTKKQKKAKQQCVSGGKYFHNGLVEDLLDITIDPNYQSNEEDYSETDSEGSSTVMDMAFCLIDHDIGDELESSECSDDEVVCTGEKRKTDGDWQEEVLDELETQGSLDYVEECASKAAASACTFWANIMRRVSVKIVSHVQLAREIGYLAGQCT